MFVYMNAMFFFMVGCLTNIMIKGQICILRVSCIFTVPSKEKAKCVKWFPIPFVNFVAFRNHWWWPPWNCIWSPLGMRWGHRVCLYYLVWACTLFLVGKANEGLSLNSVSYFVYYCFAFCILYFFPVINIWTGVSLCH